MFLNRIMCFYWFKEFWYRYDIYSMFLNCYDLSANDYSKTIIRNLISYIYQYADLCTRDVSYFLIFFVSSEKRIYIAYGFIILIFSFNTLKNSKCFSYKLISKQRETVYITKAEVKYISFITLEKFLKH